MLNLRAADSGAGLSLLELMVSCVVLAAIGVLSAQSLESMRRLGSLREATEELAAALREGQSRALGSGRDHHLFVGHTGWRLFASNESGDTRLVREKSFPSGVFGPSVAEPAVAIRFFVSGVVTPRSVVLTTERGHGKVTISLRGRVTRIIE